MRRVLFLLTILGTAIARPGPLWASETCAEPLPTEPAPAGPPATASPEAAAPTAPTPAAPATPAVVERDPDDNGSDASCADPIETENLLEQRKYRLTRDRLYIKSLRHELTLIGGYYVSDLFDSTFTVGGSYTFFMSENFGSELSVTYSHQKML